VERVKRVLIIDDDAGIREVAKMSLELVGGWSVTTAPTGADGIREARDGLPDGILLDVMMPDLDGPATLEELRNDEVVGGTPVIFLTAKVQASERTRFAELDVAGLIAKPFDPMTLHERVAELFGWTS
jgi:two-component system alkaline phosphatase synthesis response regulator PhoP